MGVAWAAGQAEIVVTAHLGAATSIPIRWGAGRPGDGDESEIEPTEDPRRTRQKSQTLRASTILAGADKPTALWGGPPFVKR